MDLWAFVSDSSLQILCSAGLPSFLWLHLSPPAPWLRLGCSSPWFCLGLLDLLYRLVPSAFFGSACVSTASSSASVGSPSGFYCGPMSWLSCWGFLPGSYSLQLLPGPCGNLSCLLCVPHLSPPALLCWDHLFIIVVNEAQGHAFLMGGYVKGNCVCSCFVWVLVKFHCFQFVSMVFHGHRFTLDVNLLISFCKMLSILRVCFLA